MKLGVNIDHVATLREARYRGRISGEPDVIHAAVVCQKAGADGITAHLREDRRHMQDRDIRALRHVVTTRFNLELGNTPEIVAIALEVKPEIVCLVPENRQEVTTEGGLDVVRHRAALQETRERMNAAGIEVSLFINPDPEQIVAARAVGAQFVELHTGQFAERYEDPEGRGVELGRLQTAARLAVEAGLKVNAGHGLNYENVGAMRSVPGLEELNIGHSIVSRAVLAGLPEAVGEMKALILTGRS